MPTTYVRKENLNSQFPQQQNSVKPPFFSMGFTPSYVVPTTNVPGGQPFVGGQGQQYPDSQYFYRESKEAPSPLIPLSSQKSSHYQHSNPSQREEHTDKQVT